MDITAGQEPERVRARVDSPGRSGVMTVAEEEHFWRSIRRQFPDEPAPPSATPADTSWGRGTGERRDPWRALGSGRVDPDALRGLEPSGLLLDLLDGVPSTELDDTARFDDLAVLEMVAAWQRVVSMATAGAARAAAALSRRECLQVPQGPVPVGRGYRRYTTLRATGTEIAIRTGCTVRSGELLARDGRLFDGVLAATGAALAAGRIDPRTARLLTDRLADLPIETVLDVQERVLANAGVRSPAQVERDLTRALVEVDAPEASARHRRARAGRRVCHPTMLPDGMAGMWAVLPAESAALVDAALGDAAASARAAGDPRSVDQLRADGLVDLTVGSGLVIDGDLAARGGLAVGDGLAAHGDLAAGGRSEQPPRPGSTSRPVRESRPRAPGPTVHVDVTVALSTLLGLDDAPGDLAGYGAITAEQAAALAAGGALRRIVTDPLTGAVLDVGRTRYRPPAAIRAHVIARDRTCARPGCVVPAQRAELDHTVPFGPVLLRDPTQPEPGATGPGSRARVPSSERAPHSSQGDTSVGNLAPLCAADHLAKTLGLLHLEQPAPGVLDWTTATGQRVRVVPGRNGEITPLQQRPRTSPGPRPRSEPPPF